MERWVYALNGRDEGHFQCLRDVSLWTRRRRRIKKHTQNVKSYTFATSIERRHFKSNGFSLLRRRQSKRDKTNLWWNSHCWPIDLADQYWRFFLFTLKCWTNVVVGMRVAITSRPGFSALRASRKCARSKTTRCDQASCVCVCDANDKQTELNTTIMNNKFWWSTWIMRYFTLIKVFKLSCRTRSWNNEMQNVAHGDAHSVRLFASVHSWNRHSCLTSMCTQWANIKTYVRIFGGSGLLTPQKKYHFRGLVCGTEDRLSGFSNAMATQWRQK